MIYRVLILTAVLLCLFLAGSPTQAITPYNDILMDQALWGGTHLGAAVPGPGD